MATKKPTWESYLASGYYNAAGVTDLQNQANQYSTDRTSLSAQAQNQLQAQYNQNQRAIEQQAGTQMNAFNNQLSGLDLTFDQQRRAAQSQYDQSGSAALNALTKRGLGRSSVVGDTLGDLEAARGQALNDIGAKQADTYADIRNNMTLAQQQAAAAMQGLTSDLASQVLARTDELYNTNLAAQTNIQAQIAALQQTGWQQYVSWYYSKGPGKKNGSSGGGSSKSSSGNKTTPPPAADTNPFTPPEYVDNFGKDRY